MTHPNILERYYAKDCLNYLDDNNELYENEANDNDKLSCLCIKKCLIVYINVVIL